VTDQPSSEAFVSSPARERIALALWLGIAALQIAVSFAVGGSGSDRDGEPFYDYSLAAGSLLLYGILIVVTFWIASLYPNRLAALGLRRFPARTLWLVLGVVIASVAVSALLEPILHAGREQGLEPEEWRSDRVAPFVVNAIVVVTLVPFTEELFFRGLGVRVLRFLGPIVAVVGTAIVFSLAHGILVAVPALGFFALLLGWLRVRTDSVWPCVIAHGLYNGIGVLAFYVSSAT
jgi:membrane protease YdiL (CAAX protease family)